MRYSDEIDERELEQNTMRNASISRRTGETQIRIGLELDGKGKAEISTGIGFFDHMLNAFARHGMFDLEVDAKGDLEVDGQDRKSVV